MVKIPATYVWVNPNSQEVPVVMAMFRDRGQVLVATLGPVGQSSADRALTDFKEGRTVWIRRNRDSEHKQDWSPRTEMSGRGAEQWPSCRGSFFFGGNAHSPTTLTYVNPVGLEVILTAPGGEGFEEGSALVYLRKVNPGPYIGRGKAGDVPSTALHHWLLNLFHMRKDHIPEEKMFELFMAYDGSDRAAILDEIAGLAEDPARDVPKRLSQKTTLVIQIGSHADGNLFDVEAIHEITDPTIRSSQIEDGITRAITRYGASDCRA